MNRQQDHKSQHSSDWLEKVLSDHNHLDQTSELIQPRPENRIFTNRNLKLSRIHAVGFDLDYTLAQYRQARIDALVFELTVGHLVRDKGYPETLLGLAYDGSFAIRGLVIDTKLGNVLKMDKFRYVSLAFHGLRMLEPNQRRETYTQQRIKFNSTRFRVVDTLFELVETYLFSAVIDQMERKGEQVNYNQVFGDIRETVDLMHRDDSLKTAIMVAPETYIEDDTMLVPTLHKFAQSGKHLFIVTNSEAKYTEFVLDYLFRNAAPYFASWRHCFEMVCAESKKPAFFGAGREPEIVEQRPCLFVRGGSLGFVEDELGIAGDEVLYVGDHIYGDILRSKRSSSWRTCMVVPELTAQIRVDLQVGPLMGELQACESKHKDFAMDFNQRSNQIKMLYEFKESEADDLGPQDLQNIDRKIAELNRKLERNNRELSSVLHRSRELRNGISSEYNSYWGRLFQTGGQLSAFAEQIRDYACLYTSKVSNFNYYSMQNYFKSYVSPMPHELEPIRSEVDYDESLESAAAN